MTAVAGVLGAGVFGTTVASLISHNADVLLYTRDPQKAERINREHSNLDFEIPGNVLASSDLKDICEQASVLFPIVPSAVFCDLMHHIRPYLRPSHLMIHGTKGLDIKGISEDQLDTADISRKNFRTMSEVILAETRVVRVGCLSGPNLAREIMEGQPAASVVASAFDEVIEAGQRFLSSSKFFVFGSHDLKGAELAGAFKNIIALGSGLLEGLGMGRNLQSMFIVRTLREIIHLGKAFGSSSQAFLGAAGIGDIIATSMSEKSRNFHVGTCIAAGQSIEQVQASMNEVAEGIRTLKVAYRLARHYDVQVPIIQLLYRVIFENRAPKEAIDFLMRYPLAPDVDFL